MNVTQNVLISGSLFICSVIKTVNKYPSINKRLSNLQRQKRKTKPTILFRLREGPHISERLSVPMFLKNGK